jgi:hypothetical protein
LLVGLAKARRHPTAIVGIEVEKLALSFAKKVVDEPVILAALESLFLESVVPARGIVGIVDEHQFRSPSHRLESAR